MKNLLLLVIILISTLQSCKEEISYEMPLPTNGDTHVKEDMEDPAKSNAKKEWLKKLFRTPEGMDAEYIELQNSYAKFKKRNKSFNTRTPFEIIADGLIEGEWLEKGSKNQSGSVFVTEYDQETKEVYLISAGGQLWKGGLDGTTWEVVNQKARFHNQFLDFVETADTTKRILAAISNKPHYSDDNGLTWIASEGFEPQSFARIKNPFTVDDSLSYTYFLGQENSNQNLGLYVTKDKGITYDKIFSFFTSDRRNLALSITKNSQKIYVLEQVSTEFSRLHCMNSTQDTLKLLEAFSPVSFNQGSGSFVSVMSDTTTYMYALSRSDSSSVHLSIDEGKTWTKKSTLPSNPWGVGIFVSANNPDFLLYGDIECYRSFDGGESWSKINGWGDYYDDVMHKLHADMMYFSDYIDKDTEEYFMLISNHGGISIMTDYEQEPTNISLQGLNVSQYYSVRSHPLDASYIYAGSQDQGFQRALDKEGELIDFSQAISGDYGHIVFTLNEHLWTVYPGGWVSYWPKPKHEGIALSYTLESSQESVWIPPLVANPGEDINQIFMAGGNINGGNGSYLIKLYATSVEIEASQFDFNFRSASGGSVSAIAIGDEDAESIYVATDNGKFFYSHDYGENFTKSATVNGAHYLYGQKIILSKINTNKIYTGGTGYNGVPAMRSIDGGETFEPFGEGLPNTTILDMAMNEDESLLFAATTSGPYVCVLAEHKWYDMTGEAAPDVTYWSVELVKNGNTVRFGTYGRGIWDFEISLFVKDKETEIMLEENVKVYPNPVSEITTIEWPEGDIFDAAIFDISGKLLIEIPTENKKTIVNLTSYTTGQYFIRFNHNNIIKSKTIIKL